MKNRPLLLLSLGVLIAWAAMIAYFKVMVFFPALRDSGVLNELLALAGLVLAFWGLLKGWSAKPRRFLHVLLFLLALLPAGFQSFYIRILSYQLPAAENSPAPGAQAPPLQLPDQSSRSRSLDDLFEDDSRFLVLVFFRGHW